MKKKITGLLMAAGLATVLSSAAYGQGLGNNSFETKTDPQSGNTYSIQRSGDQTIMRGHNPNTGSSWSQRSQSSGSSTFHSGQSSDGNSWSGTTSNNGSTTLNQGIDSSGDPYSSSSSNLGNSSSFGDDQGGFGSVFD